MQYRRFGNSDLTVSEIGFGCARLGGLVTQNQARGESPVQLLQHAFDAGITFFDTADMYTQGESETLLGKAFHGRRDKVVIASKGGYCLPTQRKMLARIKPLVRPLVRVLGLKRENLPTAVSGTIAQNFSPDYLRTAIEASLRRLQTDYLDLYQLHSPPAAVIRSGECIEILETLKKQGKIRYYGIAVDTVEDALECLPFSGVTSVMTPFGLLDPEALTSFLPQAEARHLAVIARGCFGGGLLNPSLSSEELQSKTSKWPQILTYRQAAEQHHRSLPELALQYSLSHSSITVHLLGMRTVSHLRTNIGYLNTPPLKNEERQILHEVRLNIRDN